MSYENKEYIISEEAEKKMLLDFAEQFGYSIEKPEEATLEELRNLGIQIIADKHKSQVSTRQISIIPDEQISIEEYMNYNVPMIHLVNNETVKPSPIQINSITAKNVTTRSLVRAKNKVGYKSKKC